MLSSLELAFQAPTRLFQWRSLVSTAILSIVVPAWEMYSLSYCAPPLWKLFLPVHILPRASGWKKLVKASSILSINRVVNRFGVQYNVQFKTEFRSTHYNDAKPFWKQTKQSESTYTSRFLVRPLGPLTIPNSTCHPRNWWFWAVLCAWKIIPLRSS